LLATTVQSVGLFLVALIFSWPAIYPWLRRFSSFPKIEIQKAEEIS
jgi:hypothetical protein